MTPPSRRSRRALLVLTALFAVLLAFLAIWTSLPPRPQPPEAPVSLTPAPAPAVLSAAADRTASTEVSGRSRIIPGPAQWRQGGAHVPECWDRAYRPRSLAAERRCTAGDRVDFCVVGSAKLDGELGVESVDTMLATVEATLGLERQGRITVVLYDDPFFKRARLRRRLGPGVAGWFDGHVHVSTDHSAPRTAEILRHEMVHAVMAPAIGCAPRSVHEGVADWFDGDIHKGAWTYLLWRGRPFDAHTLEALITSDDGYEVGLAYAEASARVEHAISSRDEATLRSWLQRIRSGALSNPAAAWAELDAVSEGPIAETIAPLLLAEPWTRDLQERLKTTSLACASLSTDEEDSSLTPYGAAAQRRGCAMLDRDPDDPDLDRRLAFAIEHHDELLERSSENRLAMRERVLIRP